MLVTPFLKGESMLPLVGDIFLISYALQGFPMVETSVIVHGFVWNILLT